MGIGISVLNVWMCTCNVALPVTTLYAPHKNIMCMHAVLCSHVLHRFPRENRLKCRSVGTLLALRSYRNFPEAWVLSLYFIYGKKCSVCACMFASCFSGNLPYLIILISELREAAVNCSLLVSEAWQLVQRQSTREFNLFDEQTDDGESKEQCSKTHATSGEHVKRKLPSLTSCAYCLTSGRLARHFLTPKIYSCCIVKGSFNWRMNKSV